MYLGIFKAKKTHKKLNGSENECPVCGQSGLREIPILNKELVQAWELSKAEEALINQQQGQVCTNCNSNLRTRTLAKAICKEIGWDGLLKDIGLSKSAKKISLLEINEAGNLTKYLSLLPKHKMLCYPEVDLQNIRLAAESFDVIVHSDTLEHVADPIKALTECRRILKEKGKLIFTIPVVPSKLTRSREGLAASFHGDLNTRQHDMLVYTEYGADFYLQLIAAGWLRFEVLSLGTAASFAIVAHKD